MGSLAPSHTVLLSDRAKNSCRPPGRSSPGGVAKLPVGRFEYCVRGEA